MTPPSVESAPVYRHFSRPSRNDGRHFSPANIKVVPVTEQKMAPASGERVRRQPGWITDRLAPALAGYSPVMRRLRWEIKRIACTSGPIHLIGEAGTGKATLARTIHECGPHRERRFLVVECDRGAGELFSSAVRGQLPPDLTMAGTIYLRQVEALSLCAQAGLLHFLRKQRADGEEETAAVNIIAGTRLNLHAAVNRGAFRPDLFFRLFGVGLRLPPLRERREDIPLLVSDFLERQERLGRPTRVSPEALRALISYAWPGNVRELRGALDYALRKDEDQLLSLADLPSHVSRSECLDDLGWRDSFIIKPGALSPVWSDPLMEPS